MTRFCVILLAVLGGAVSVSARAIPPNLLNFYNSLKTNGTCTTKLATGFYTNDDGPDTFYCGDHLPDYNIIYIQGANHNLADMDVDCDGTQHNQPSTDDHDDDDGRCANSADTQSVTAFQSTVEDYNKGIKDLDASVHPYVVFGNSGSKRGWKTFDPTDYGVYPLSVMAVVCGDKLIYGIWGDTNGDDGSKPLVGEASLSLATACFGTSMNGNNGHDETDVLYIAFAGVDAVPGADGADWAATSWQAFESSIEGLGERLVRRIAGGTPLRSDRHRLLRTR